MSKINRKFVFMGTPEIAAHLLESLILDGYEFVALVAQPDHLKDKKGRLIAVPTKEIALKYHIPVFQPVKIKDDYRMITPIECDLAICLAYGQIVPQEILDWPQFGCVNVHGSLLPEYRGASPIQYALFDGRTETGVTIQKMTFKMDAGDIISQHIILIDDTDDFSSLEEKMKKAIPQFVKDVIPSYLAGAVSLVKQKEENATFCRMIKKEDEKLDHAWPGRRFVNTVRGLSLVPGGYLFNESGKKVKIMKAEVYSAQVIAATGTINKCLKDDVILQVADGEVRLLLLQEEGKKLTVARDFANGHQKLQGQRWQ